MAIHKESAAKQAIRLLLRDACEHLQRGKLTYLGLPSNEALDILVLGDVLENVICVDEKKSVLDETRLSIAAVPLKQRRFIVSDMWTYLRDQYPAEPLTADVTFLDFYGGGLRKENPFAEELAGLRAYFAKQSRYPNRSFILGWTYMPRDKGKGLYVEACEKILPVEECEQLRRSSGMWSRTLAIRLLLHQSCREHGLLAKVFQHAVYKHSMNALIAIFSRGPDATCRLALEDPARLVDAPLCVYDAVTAVPRFVAASGM